MKTTADANKLKKVEGKKVEGENFEQIRTRLTPKNRDIYRENLRKFAISENLAIYHNYPINNGMGRAYLDLETNLFVGIDQEGIIRKTYPAGQALMDFLANNCDLQTPKSESNQK